MRLQKTELGRDVMVNKTLPLSLRDRQILIFCDGKRTREQIRTMFGEAAGDTLDRLVQMDLLLEAESTRDTDSQSLSVAV